MLMPMKHLFWMSSANSWSCTDFFDARCNRFRSFSDLFRSLLISYAITHQQSEESIDRFIRNHSPKSHIIAVVFLNGRTGRSLFCWLPFTLLLACNSVKWSQHWQTVKYSLTAVLQSLWVMKNAKRFLLSYSIDFPPSFHFHPKQIHYHHFRMSLYAYSHAVYSIDDSELILSMSPNTRKERMQMTIFTRVTRDSFDDRIGSPQIDGVDCCVSSSSPKHRCLGIYLVEDDSWASVLLFLPSPFSVNHSVVVSTTNRRKKETIFVIICSNWMPRSADLCQFAWFLPLARWFKIHLRFTARGNCSLPFEMKSWCKEVFRFRRTDRYRSITWRGEGMSDGNSSERNLEDLTNDATEPPIDPTGLIHRQILRIKSIAAFVQFQIKTSSRTVGLLQENTGIRDHPTC